MNQEPQRLLDDGAISSTLRRDLGNARAAAPGYDVAAGVARFEASLQAAPAIDGAPAAGHTLASRKATTTWWILGGGAVAAAVAAWSLASDPEPRPSQREPPAAAHSREMPAELAVPEEPPPRPEPIPRVVMPAEPAASDVDVQPAARKRSPIKSPAPTEPAAPQQDDALTREMAATAAAKRALASDPARALELVAEANRTFKNGVYAEDREGIAVLALAKLGREDQARARGEAYLAAHPKGTYADRIRSVLGQP